MHIQSLSTLNPNLLRGFPVRRRRSLLQLVRSWLGHRLGLMEGRPHPQLL